MKKCIESNIKQMQQRPDIKLKIHISEAHFCDLLRDNNSALINNAPKEYGDAIVGQAKVCQKVFTKPICVIAGAAGTGKTTILKSIIKSMRKPWCRNWDSSSGSYRKGRRTTPRENRKRIFNCSLFLSSTRVAK